MWVYKGHQEKVEKEKRTMPNLTLNSQQNPTLDVPPIQCLTQYNIKKKKIVHKIGFEHLF